MKKPLSCSGVTLVCLIMEVSLNNSQFNFDFWLMAIKCLYRKSTVDLFDGELTCVWFLDHVQKIPPTLCWLIVDPRLPEVSPTCGSLSTGATSPVKSSGTLRTWKMFGVTSMLRQVRPPTQLCFFVKLFFDQWPMTPHQREYCYLLFLLSTSIQAKITMVKKSRFLSPTD